MGLILVSLPAACRAAWAPAAGTVPSGGSRAGAEAARHGPLLCSSPRCWDQVATTTVSTPPHRRDALPLSPLEPPDPSPPVPGPCAKFICRFLPRIMRGCGRLCPWPAPYYSCHSELVLSPRMGGRGLAARCPQHLGMTCRLHFCTGATYLSCTCHSINSVCAPRPFAVLSIVAFVFFARWPVQLKADQTQALPGCGWGGRGHLPDLGWWAGRGRSLQSEGKGGQKSLSALQCPLLLTNVYSRLKILLQMSLPL